MSGPFINGGDQVYSTYLSTYSEPDALNLMIHAAERALDRHNYRVKKAIDFTLDQFTITVGGASFAFILGGPQFEALVAFVEHICDENLYEFDREYLTVRG